MRAENPANNPAFLLELEERMHTSRDTQAAVHELFTRGQLRFVLHDGQRRIQETIDQSVSKEFLVFCSRQFGKSFFGLVYTLQFLQQNPRTKAYIFAGTNKDAMDIANDNLSVIQRLAPEGWIKRYKTELGTGYRRIYFTSNYNENTFRTCRRFYYYSKN